ncbi:MAG: SdpI family protein [Flavobacteriales bacterium]|nr:SdpI family protein [Flavobacteriales bacterium]
MKLSFRKEIPFIALIAVPFIYLAYVWQDLPLEVPIHWNIKGEIDRYGSRYELLLIPILLPLLTYLLFLVIPLIDPKKKIKMMGKKYNKLKLILLSFMSFLAVYIIYSTETESLTKLNALVLGLGILYMLLGNYFKTIKPNYFIGIRTPWTLENESVWKKTHEFSGKLWFIGGLIIIISSLLLEEKLSFNIFISITVILSIVTILYSYLEHKKLTSQA